MENETVDYGKVTGMVHSTESFGAVDGPGIRFIVFLQAVKCGVNTATIQILGQWETNKSRERTVDDVLEEASAIVDFGVKKGEYTVSGGEASCRLTF